MVIKTDGRGFPVDNSGDGGDSSHFAGLLARVSSEGWGLLRYYQVVPGILVRYPHKSPWNNPKNFTRDQLVAFIAGCAYAKEYTIIRRVFWKHALRIGFCQNTERDYPGSTKYPWPHKFYEDSDTKKKIVQKWFDAPDILSPGNWIFLLKATNYPLFKPIVWLFSWVFSAEMYLFCRFDSNDDETNMILQADLMGLRYLKQYSCWRKNWNAKLYRKWITSRNMPWAYDALIDIVLLGEKYGRTADLDSKSTHSRPKSNAENWQSRATD